MALTNNNQGALYIRVELPRVYGKYRVQYDLIQYVDHPITGEKAEVGREVMECDYDLDGLTSSSSVTSTQRKSCLMRQLIAS